MEPPTLLESEKPKFRFEHGTEPGMNDETLVEKRERLEARGEWPPPPPIWQTQLRNKLRCAQEGRFWEKVGTGNTGPLGIERREEVNHQELLWDSICHQVSDQVCGFAHGAQHRGLSEAQMSELMDHGCGHEKESFDAARKQIYETMKIPNPRRNGRDILDKIERNRRRAQEQEDAQRRRELETGEKGSEDCSSDEERELLAIRNRRLQELKTLRRGFKSVTSVAADSFLEEVVNVGRVWVVVHVYDHGRQDCQIMDQVFTSLARRHGNVIKFVKVHYSDVLPDLDQATELPQVLFYRQGDIMHQVCGLLDLGVVSVGVEGKVSILKDAEIQDPTKQIEASLQKLLDEHKALGPTFAPKGRGDHAAALSDDEPSSTDATTTSDDNASGELST